MPEQVSPYKGLGELYETLPQPETAGSDTRSRTLADQARLSITRLISAAQRAFMVGLGGTNFYVSHEGLEWVSFPDISVSGPVRQADVLGITLLNISVNPLLSVGSDKKQPAAELFVGWAEECALNNRLIPFPVRANFQLT